MTLAELANENAKEENIIPQAKMMEEMMLSTSNRLFIQQQKMTIPTMITDSKNIQMTIEWSIHSAGKQYTSNL
ncbi:MAG: hypothetical protein HRT68_15995 [Flavobacteriaceae bacterium]|nr:hypothetical protein [Flavobacteriaceae bacterium]